MRQEAGTSDPLRSLDGAALLRLLRGRHVSRAPCLLHGAALLACLLLTAGIAGSQEAPPDIELAPIQVEGVKPEEKALVERSFETPEDVTGFGETIFAEPLWRSFETPAELLGESVGAQIRRQGGRDDFSTLTIRGAPSAQVRILLDGVALGRASDSVVNLADLPMDIVERIEIYRGFAPVSLTPVSAAGVVNVVTRQPDKATAMAAAGGGSFGTAKVNVGGAGPLLGGSASAFAAYRHTEGDFDYVDPGLEHNPDDSKVGKRTNNDGDAVEGLVRWNRSVTDGTDLRLRNHLFYKVEGVPGIAAFPRDARLETTREIAAAGIGSKDGRWNVDEIVTWEEKRLSDSDSFDSTDNTSETAGSSSIVRFARPLGESHWLSGSGDFTYEDFDQNNERPALVDAQADRSSLAVAVGDDWTVERLRTTLGMQLRHQELWNSSNSTVAPDDHDRSTDPRVGLKWEPLAGLAIKSNVSTYFRPPNFDELYGTDGFTVGNPRLEPETGLAWDAGPEWTFEREPFGKLGVSYSYFGSDIDDIIVVQLNFRRESRADNVSKAKIRGHEFRLEWKGPAGLALSGNYTHQDARNDSGTPGLDGLDLPGIAPDEGWMRVSWTRGLFVLSYDLDVTGSHYIDSEHDKPKLPTRTVHGVSVVCGPFWNGWRVTLEGSNLGDSLVPDEIGYPLPGRAFYATLSWAGSYAEKS